MAPDPALGRTPADQPPAGRWLRPVRDTGIDSAAAELDAGARQDIARIRAWLPPVEDAAFDCYLGNLADRMDPYTQADPAGVLASLVGVAGVHLGPGPHLQLGYGERHPLLIWPMLIGATGIGRKGTATNVAVKLLGQADPEFLASNKHSGLSSGEGLAALFATDTEQDGKRGGKRGGKPRLLPDGDSRLLVVETEWASVIARMRREGNTLSATLRSAWEGGNLSTLNVDARMARQSHIGIISHITPKEFREKVSTTDMAGGTYNRFLPIAVAQSKYFPPLPDTTLTSDLSASLADRLQQASGLGAVTFTDAAEFEWRRLQLEFGRHLGGDGQVEEFVSRAGVTCVRIAAIYAALDRTDRITPAHLASAAALIRYSIASARAVLSPHTTDTRLIAFIAAAGQEGRTRTEITTDLFKNKPPKNLGDVLTQLVDNGQLTTGNRPRADGQTSGRRAQVFTAVPRE
ncbi:DUF3987 domain-containing protein [Lentzea sp. PSKA42]|uniref:DUF3987 domain-containing protein n=1 Tax=Lentzea indica TaxID=2604800 RepID=A0ABX1FK82_9PSEU|nr:DUF3987 domain-containing protein [Lentzea indica]NKE59394.1 DUF3987 domain-containing protein [Lentzea indica]